MTRDPMLVIGVGNRDRGDDAIGPLVADAVDRRCGDDVLTVIAEGDLSDLAVRWHAEQDVVVIDATQSGQPVGTVSVIDAMTDRLPTESGLLSSHGVGLGEAIELARLLDRLPRSLIVIGVEAATFEHLAPPSHELVTQLPDIVEVVAHRVKTLRRTLGDVRP